jgi:hypothetical protein
MTNQTIPVRELFNYAYLLSPIPVFCLLKHVACVCTSKMAEVGLSAYFTFSQRYVPSNVINLLSLPSPCLYLVFRGG